MAEENEKEEYNSETEAGENTTPTKIEHHDEQKHHEHYTEPHKHEEHHHNEEHKYHADAESHKSEEHKHQPEEHKQPAAEEPKKQEKNILSLVTFTAVVLLLLVNLGIFFHSYNLLNHTAGKSDDQAKLQLTVIDPECADCASIDEVKTAVGAELNITNEITLKASSSEAKSLISKYNITNLPAILLTGETQKAGTPPTGFEKTGDAFVYVSSSAPYVDAATGKVKGLVSVLYINSTGCKNCPNLMPALTQLEGQVKITDLKVLDKDSQEAKQLIASQGIERLPALLFSQDITEYDLGKQLVEAGAVAKNGWIELKLNPPFINLSNGKTVGATNVILLNDSSCKTCYDVTLHLSILARLQVYVESTRVVDAASEEGKALVSKYKILALPTVLVMGDGYAYDSLNSVWPSVGTIESDGTYILRDMKALPGMPFLNVSTGKVDLNSATATN